ncbi:odorant receptor 4-like [Ceratina calcarata]|uniref:Odorant receptor n=1 Tax=Ceratina calcarata TaxID=156304 RepID=A0AAJ7S3R0_9HYME|nr:odorant receptor 4-like [Ceratina calcarata]
MAAKSIISDLMETCLRLTGLWPDSSYRILKRTAFITVLLTFVILQFWYCIIHVKNESMVDLLDKLSVAISNSVVFAKFVAICIHQRVLTETLAIMAEDWNDLEQSDSRIMIQKAALADRITKITLMIYFPTVPFYTATIFLSPSDDTTEKKFLLHFPFNLTETPVYETVVSVQVIEEWILSLTAGAFMALSTTLVIHVAARIEVITEKLKQDLDCRNEKEARLMSMRGIIVKHERVIVLSENIETLFTMVALAQFLYNTIVMCFIGFVLVTALDTGQFFTALSRTFSFYLSVNFEALILCYTGEYLTTKGEYVGLAAYNSNWYDLSVQETRALLLIILRSQKSLTLTIGKFTNLSLVTFANMMKASASYVSVLYAME